MKQLLPDVHHDLAQESRRTNTPSQYEGGGVDVENHSDIDNIDF